MKRADWAFALIGSILVVSFVGTLQDGGIATPDSRIPQDEVQSLRDIQVVWLVERAVFAGFDPSLPLDELADAGGVEVAGDSVLEYHPRVPGSYILEAWVAAFPRGYVAAFGLGAAAIGLFLVIGLTGVLKGKAVPVVLFPLLVLTDVIDSLAFWRSTSWMVSVSILGCWILARRRDSTWAGLALVPGITLRLFPLIFVPLLWLHGRRRSAIAAVAGSVALNLIGLVLPNVTIESTVRVLTQGKTDFLTSFGNGSLWALIMRPGGHVAFALAASVVVVGGLWVWTRRMNFDRAFGLAIVVGLIAVPVSWSHFRLALAPLVASPMGLTIWAVELAGRLVFEWRWITGLLASLAAGVIWHVHTRANVEEQLVEE